MIPQSELERRLGVTVRALTCHRQYALHPATGITATRIREAGEQLRTWSRPHLVSRAYLHLDEHQAGYPSSSVPEASGIGGVSDRTGRLVTQHEVDPELPNDRPRVDPVAREIRSLEIATARLEHDSLTALDARSTYPLGRRIAIDAETVKLIIESWSTDPQARWCTHCWSTNKHRTLADRRYTRPALCRSCGEWKGVNGQLPVKEILEYLQRREARRIPQRLLNQHRAKVPRSRRR